MGRVAVIVTFRNDMDHAEQAGGLPLQATQLDRQLLHAVYIMIVALAWVCDCSAV